MKKLLVLAMLHSIGVLSAQLQDNTQMIESTSRNVLGYTFQFSPGFQTTVRPQKMTAFNAIESYSNPSTGELELISNGWFVTDSSGRRLHTDTLSPDAELFWHSPNNGGAPLYYMYFVDIDSTVFFLHGGGHTFQGNNLGLGYRSLYYSRLNKRNGRWVIQTNNLIAADITNGFLLTIAPTRHANGRDWWVTAFDYSRPRAYSYLLTERGIVDTVTSVFNSRVADPSGSSGVFSPNGEIFVMGGHYFNLKLFDFDRCTGLFSYRQEIPIFDTNYLMANTSSFSPNNRYLYSGQNNIVIQFDTQAPDIIASADTVLGVLDTFDLSRHNLILRPDNKIYISGFNGNKIGRIEYPDRPGRACSVVDSFYILPFGVRFPKYSYVNYRLGPKAGTVCDSLLSGIGPPLPEPPKPQGMGLRVELYPNPASDYLTIDARECAFGPEARYALIDALGRTVLSGPLQNQKQWLDLTGMQSGLYFLELREEGRLLEVRKVLKQ